MAKVTRLGSYPNPRVWFAPHVMRTIHALCHECDVEISWFGLGTIVEQDNNIDAYIYDIHVPTQTGSATVTVAQLSEVCNWLHDEGRDDEEENLCYWGHSHVDMGVGPSRQDDKALHEFHDMGYKLFVRGIHNRRGEVNAACVVSDDLGAWVITDIPWVLGINDPEFDAEIASIVDSKVEEDSYSYGHGYGYKHTKPWKTSSKKKEEKKDSEHETQENVKLTPDVSAEQAIRRQMWQNRFPNWVYLTYPPGMGVDNTWDDTMWDYTEREKAIDQLIRNSEDPVGDELFDADDEDEVDDLLADDLGYWYPDDDEVSV